MKPLLDLKIIAFILVFVINSYESFNPFNRTQNTCTRYNSKKMKRKAKNEVQ